MHIFASFQHRTHGNTFKHQFSTSDSDDEESTRTQVMVGKEWSLVSALPDNSEYVIVKQVLLP
jgi:hypothetical protein